MTVLNPLDILYTFSYIKLGCSFIKYIPQLRLNYQRKSTIGWSVRYVFFSLLIAIFCLPSLEH